MPGTRRSVYALLTRPLALIIVMSLFVLSLSSAAEAVTTPGITPRWQAMQACDSALSLGPLAWAKAVVEDISSRAGSAEL